MPKGEAINLERYSYEAIKKGSLSFSFASTLFSRKVRDRVVKLYAWCRFVDDQIDDENVALEHRKWRLDKIAKQSFDTLVSTSVPPAIAAFRVLRHEIHMPKEHPFDLLSGMRMDLDRERYASLEDLELYCYRVAGVVGLMMTHVMGVSSPKAYQHAVDLGVAMQLTNISRDILTDARMGRIYVPLDWLSESSLPSDPMFFEETDFKDKLVPLVQRLLLRADTLYKSGDEGLKYLPFRCSMAVAIAREVYSAIGREVTVRGASAWDTRTYIPLSRKLRLGLKGLGKSLWSRIQRLKRYD
ncbi:MAG: phytoene/squalene synthase family protein [Proteobacteria bacterium]|nr:MAG: phytoene/squalene synthase family protein [Pseudomonadota bacterium]